MTHASRPPVPEAGTSNIGHRRALLLVIAGALLVRVCVALLYQPMVTPDSGTYLELAEQLRTLNFADYTGWRTPTYPLLVVVAGGNLWVAALLQSALGVLTTAMLFAIVMAATGSPGAGVLAAAAHTLALNQLLMEWAVMAESTTTFLLVLTVFLSQRFGAHVYPRGGPIAVGLASAASALCRPVFAAVALVFWALALVLGRERRVRNAVTLALAFAIPVAGWCFFNKATLGYFGVTALTGYNLTNHSGPFMQDAPDRYREIRDIYLKHREQRIAESGHQSWTAFYARDDLMKATGMSDVELTRALTKISLELLATHPGGYARSVADAWVRFWAAAMYVDPDNFRFRPLAAWVERVYYVEKWALRIAFLAFVLTAPLTAWMAWTRRREGPDGWTVAASMAAIVLAASVLQALTELGDNGRYGMPTQSLAIAALIVWAVKWRRSRSRRESSAVASMALR